MTKRATVTPPRSAGRPVRPTYDPDPTRPLPFFYRVPIVIFCLAAAVLAGYVVGKHSAVLGCLAVAGICLASKYLTHATQRLLTDLARRRTTRRR